MNECEKKPNAEIKFSALLAFINKIQEKHENRVWLEINKEGNGGIMTYTCCDDKEIIGFDNLEQLCRLING